MTKKTFVLAGFIVLKFLLQYSLISPEYDLQRDEFLHLDQANHFAWGYMSVPPFTSWISFVINLLGNSVFWVKFFPALFGSLTIFITWKAIESLKGNLFSLVLGATCVLFSALLRLNTLFQPNSFDVLAWTAFYFFLIKFIQTNYSKWLFFAAVTFAIGFLNKYSIAFLLMGLLPAILLSAHRRLFLEKRFYISLALGLLIMLPNLLWQYNNGFPVIHHLKELADTQLVNVDRTAFLKSQVLFYLGASFVILLALYALVFYKPFKPYRFFFPAIIFTLAAFMYFRAKDYYAIGIYPLYIAFGSVYLAGLLKTGWKKYLKPIAIAIPILLFIPVYKVAFPNKSPEYIVKHPQRYKDFGLLRWEDGKDHSLPQDFADMLGWRDLAIKVDSVWSTLPHPENTLILCDNYGQAGAINYYSTNKKLIASSFNADYINWLKLDKKITDVLLVKEPGDDDKNRKEEIPLFDSVSLAAQRINPFAREDTISIYILKGAKIDINSRIRVEVQRRKNH